mmetsp:Transcript_125158/g.267167  ORF Transcript_125158/g.267167 Transcript_125158/m.267167 type:complete len:208 (+) Transcript_125158:994-1617(+)
MNTASNVLRLRALGRTTIGTDGLHARRPAEFVGLLLDLDRQLAGGRNHEQSGVPSSRPCFQHHGEGGHQERQGLAAPRGRHTDDVATLHGQRPCVLLDLRRRGEARLLDGLQELRGEGRCLECGVALKVLHRSPRGILHLHLLIGDGLPCVPGSGVPGEILHTRKATRWWGSCARASVQRGQLPANSCRCWCRRWCRRSGSGTSVGA